MRGVVHHQHDAGDDLQRKAEGQDDAPDPHPVQVLGRGDHQGVIHQPDDGQAASAATSRRRSWVRNGRAEFRTCGALLIPVGSLFRRRKRRREPAGSRARGRGGCGRTCRSASRGRGRTSRRRRASEVAGVVERHAAEVGADAHLTEPLAGLRPERGSRPVAAAPPMLSLRAPSGRAGRTQLDRARILDLLGGAAADEHRLAEPLDRQLRAGLDTPDVDADRAQRLHVGGGVHLVDERPDGGTGGDGTGARGGVIQEVAAGAFVIFCVGHEPYSSARRVRRSCASRISTKKAARRYRTAK
jgi:hypothetical protein